MGIDYAYLVQKAAFCRQTKDCFVLVETMRLELTTSTMRM